jgi:hypothetical protein
LRVAVGAASVAAIVLALVAAGTTVAPKVDARPDDDDIDIDERCIGIVVNSFTATPASVVLGATSTLRWDVRVPLGCRVGLAVNGQTVRKQGALQVTPIADTTYRLTARFPNLPPGTIASTEVRVVLPSQVTITRNDQARLLRQALGIAFISIRIENDVQLDLSAYESIPVAQGVTLIGTRTPRQPGPRLYVRDRPRRLLVISENDVRIAGLRIEGPDMDVEGGDPRATAIYIRPDEDVELRRVEIDNNEVYGWNGSAIGVNDDNDRISPTANPEAVWIHDNFIHHNQHPNSAGYGVVIGNGGYALIEQNVFDYNRHAIAGDGSDGSGYRAYRNLVLKNGGRHERVFTTHTHQFDMHGQDNCGFWDIFSDSLYNCGTAGHSIDISRNAFLYSAGPAVKIRGTPQREPRGAVVTSNVFSHALLRWAVQWTEEGVFTDENRLAIDGSDRYGTCDFDGDGRDDSFMATGQTWWYASRTSGPWTYLNTSQRLLGELALADVNGDGRCDVLTDGMISSGGTSPWMPR